MNRKDRRAGRMPSGSQGPDGTGLFALAVRHHQAGQLVEAEHLYRQVLASDGRHFASLHHLGIIALQRRQPHAAIDPIGRALAVNGRVPDCHYNMAFALQALGRIDEAVRHYQEATRLKPDYTDAHTNLGNALKQLGRLGDAAASYERVVALAPSAEAHYNLANTLAQLRRLDDAVSHFHRALALKPDLVGAHNNLGNALVAQGRPDDALPHFQRAVALDPNLVEAHVNLGTTLLRAGQARCGRRAARAGGEHQREFRRCPCQSRQCAPGARPAGGGGAMLSSRARSQARHRRNAEQSRHRAGGARRLRRKPFADFSWR